MTLHKILRNSSFRDENLILSIVRQSDGNFLTGIPPYLLHATFLIFVANSLLVLYAIAAYTAAVQQPTSFFAIFPIFDFLIKFFGLYTTLSILFYYLCTRKTLNDKETKIRCPNHEYKIHNCRQIIKGVGFVLYLIYLLYIYKN